MGIGAFFLKGQAPAEVSAIVKGAPDAPAAVANLAKHAIEQSVRARYAEAAIKKLEDDLTKLDTALLRARTKLVSMLSDPVQAFGTSMRLSLIHI